MSAPIGRRQFVASAGGTLFCTLAGHRLSSDSHVNIDQLSGGIPVPPRLRRTTRPSPTCSRDFVSDTRPRAATASGAVNTYWIKAVRAPKWNIVPTHHDGMMDKKVPGKTTFTALAYQAWAPGFAKPLGPPRSPARCCRRRPGTRSWSISATRPACRSRCTRTGSSTPTTWTAPTRASTPSPAASSRTARRSSTCGRRAPARRARGCITTTVPWTRCRCSRGCSAA